MSIISKLDRWRSAPAMPVLGRRQGKKVKYSPASVTEVEAVEKSLSALSQEHEAMIRTLRQFAAAKLSNETRSVIGIAGARSGEGCTTVALSLASALCEIYDHVLYLEAGARNGPSLQEEMGKESVGFCGYLEGKVSLEDALLPTDIESLSVLPVGLPDGSFKPLRVVSGIRRVLPALRQDFDIVLVDLPPLLMTEEGPAMVPDLDKVVFVVSAGRTEVQEVQQMIDLCETVPVAGVIMNQISYKSPGWITSLLAKG